MHPLGHGRAEAFRMMAENVEGAMVTAGGNVRPDGGLGQQEKPLDRATGKPRL